MKYQLSLAGRLMLILGREMFVRENVTFFLALGHESRVGICPLRQPAASVPGDRAITFADSFTVFR